MAPALAEAAPAAPVPAATGLTSTQGAQKKHRPGEAGRAWAQFEALGGANAAPALVPTGADKCAA